MHGHSGGGLPHSSRSLYVLGASSVEEPLQVGEGCRTNTLQTSAPSKSRELRLGPIPCPPRMAGARALGHPRHDRPVPCPPALRAPGPSQSPPFARADPSLERAPLPPPPRGGGGVPGPCGGQTCAFGAGSLCLGPAPWRIFICAYISGSEKWRYLGQHGRELGRQIWPDLGQHWPDLDNCCWTWTAPNFGQWLDKMCQPNRAKFGPTSATPRPVSIKLERCGPTLAQCWRCRPNSHHQAKRGPIFGVCGRGPMLAGLGPNSSNFSRFRRARPNLNPIKPNVGRMWAIWTEVGLDRIRPHVFGGDFAEIRISWVKSDTKVEFCRKPLSTVTRPQMSAQP